MNKGLSSVFAFILGAIFIVVIGGAFYAGTRLQKNNSVVIPKVQEGEKTLVGNDRDVHGCIGSAGYSWCETKQKCLRVWEETCGTPSSTPSIDETAVIKEAMRQAIVAKRGGSANDLTFTVSKVIGNYAQGGASAQGGGAMWFAAKVNGKWALIWDGNGVILCSDLINYPDLPTIMVPECYNDKTNKSVTR